ncbi:MAG: type III pantothenate kinase [Candidatus Melainabacteria bacterium]
MNLLTVDIGNTDIKFGLFEDSQLTRFWRVSGSLDNTPERFSAALRKELSLHNAHFDAMIYSSVVPDIADTLKKTMAFCYPGASEAIPVDPGRMKLPLRGSRYPVAQLGLDRLVNACGAAMMHPGRGVIVLDFGTATTLNVVGPDGVFLGGAIAPGFEIFTEILSRRTARLGTIPLALPENAIGTDTLSAMQSGLVHGYRGLIRELLQQITNELVQESGLPARQWWVVATGGRADFFNQLALSLELREGRHPGAEKPVQCSFFDAVDPVWTLKGLYCLYHYNYSKNISPKTSAMTLATL